MAYTPVPGNAGGGGGGGGVTDHGDLTGLGDNDHPHYAQTTTVNAVTMLTHGATTGNRRQLIAGANITFDDTVANERTVNAAAGGVTDHGALTGLADNDHPQYALATDVSALELLTHTATTGNRRRLVAGTNVTFDDTVANVRTINASGGSSLYFASQTVGVGGATSIVFSGLNGNSDLYYIIRGFGPTTNGATITAEINGSSTNVKLQVLAQASGAGSTGAANSIGTSRSTTHIHMEVAAALLASGMRRSILGHISGPFDATQYFQYLFSGAWNDTTANITSVSLVMSTANAFLEGYRATIEAVRFS